MSSSPLLAGMPVMMPAAQAVLDMAAITHNLARLRARAPYSRVMAVIKANAYGHGLIRLAQALSEADAFAVARVEEGMALREAGVRQRIAVLGGFIVREELELYAGMHRLGFSQEEFDLWRRHGGDNRLHEPRFVTVDKLDGRMGRPRQRSCLSARSARPLR